MEENTLVIFTSDHGNMDAAHRLASKGFFYEESVGVPLIMMQRGVIPAGQVDSDHLVSAGLDILPTCATTPGSRSQRICREGACAPWPKDKVRTIGARRWQPRTTPAACYVARATSTVPMVSNKEWRSCLTW